MPLLCMRAISKAFNGRSANTDVDLDVDIGQIHALLGENGAGKTTLMNILYGLYTRDGGSIEFAGEQVSFTSPKDAIARRIGMVHQHFMLVPTLTVAQNITLGLKSPGYPFMRTADMEDRIRGISQLYGLDVDPSAKISSLSVGEQQRVEILKLLYRNARLLILDEPTAVLTPQETDSLFSVLDKLRKEGHAVVIITHKIPEVMRIADAVTVLRDGKRVAYGPIGSMTAGELSLHMIGRVLGSLGKQRHEVVLHRQACTGLELQDIGLVIHKRQHLHDVSLSVAPGSIMGLAGVDGNGQKELAEVVMGIRRHTHGHVLLDGKVVDALDTAGRRSAGMAYVSDDRHHDSLVLRMDIKENLLLGHHRDHPFVKHGLIDAKYLSAYGRRIVQEYGIKTGGVDHPVGYMSGGNQQKLVLARELSGGNACMVAFQPTRGLDIGSARFVHEKLLELRDHGCAVLLVCADLDELLTLSDMVAVIHKGRIMAVMPNRDVDLKQLGLMMAGSPEEPGGRL